MDGKHEADGSKNRDDAGKKLGKSHEKTVGKLIHIGNDPAHHIAVGMSVHIF